MDVNLKSQNSMDFKKNRRNYTITSAKYDAQIKVQLSTEDVKEKKVYPKESVQEVSSSGERQTRPFRIKHAVPN